VPAGTVPPPRLTGRDVHVWEASLQTSPSTLDELARTLSRDERTRADRFVAERDRRRFIVSRGLLRTILSGYLSATAGAIEFAYGAHGKPGVAGGVTPLCFNVSHSAETVLYAVALGREVGIDLEYIRPDIAIEEIAAHVFPPDETRALRAIDADQRARAFFRLWTRREAYLKARGHGFAAVPPDVEAAPASWCRLVDLSVASDFAAALAVEGHDWRLERLTWPSGPAT